jgi:hypothetical protein
MNRVQKLLAAGFTAVAMMSAASAASATDYNLTLTPTGGGNFTSPIGAAVTGAGGSGFNDRFLFTLANPGTADSTLTTIVLSGINNIDFAVGGVLLDDLFPFAVTLGGSSPDQATLTAVGIGAGPHFIRVTGTIAPTSGGGSYGGVLNIGPIPEPATWAMMIVGMGMVGFGLRMRRRTAAAVA